MRFVAILAVALVLRISAQAQDLVVHEWGTFTSLQDEDGRTIGGINSDDEPVPAFCHGLRWDLIVGNPSQGIPRCHPDVTMRLETPVIYFHPHADATLPIMLDVTATFNGGWLTQYYPAARVEAPGYVSSGPSPGTITSKTVGSLTWKGVAVGEDGTLMDTTDHVWITPRRVDSATVTVPGSDGRRESEKYLFYRGVGHIDSPLVAIQQDGEVRVRTRNPMRIEHAWLANFDRTGTCAAIALDGLGQREELTVLLPLDVGTLNLSKLRTNMKQALVQAGLFNDEASAMLATWEVSYFKSPGLRIFFIVPDNWVETHLPLKFSIPVELKRVMIGRLELISPRQRELLRAIAEAPIPTAAMRPTDPTAQAFEQLGRFRNGLVLDELSRRPTDSLRRFVELNQLRPFEMPRQ